ncbi:hypothetical protein CL622_06125 [archaeon]|nr:hypothetical protein [archaeon]
MDKQVVLFDADGVIVRSELFGTHYQKTKGIAKEEMLPFYHGIFQECLTGKADLKEVIAPWLPKWKWGGDVDGFLLQWFEYENKVDQKIVELIRELQKNAVSCYLATNQEKYRTQYMREKMGFKKLFDGIFSSAEVGSKKPQAEFYEFIFQKLNVNKDKILYTDDTASHVEGAKEAGIDAYLYTEFEPFHEYVKPLLK